MRKLAQFLGFVFLGAGLVGALGEMFELQLKNLVGPQESDPADIIKAIVALIEALSEAPIWVALIVVGLLLVFGSRFIPQT